MTSGGTTRAGWLLSAEVAWYVVVAAAVSVGEAAPPSPPGSGRALWLVMVAVGVVAAIVALGRWWRPAATGPLALAVLGVGTMVVATFPLGSLGPLRLVLSCAVAPVLLAATARRAGSIPALGVVGLAAVAAGIDVVRRGNTLSTDLARAVHGATPSPALTVATAALLVLAPVAFGVLLRSTDAAHRAEHLARVRAEERLQVARELHDMVANHVTGIVVAVQAAGLDPQLPTSAGRTLGVIESAGNDALAAMHRMVGALRSGSLRGPADLGASGDEVVARNGDLPAAKATPLAAVRAAIGSDDRVRLLIGERPVGPAQDASRGTDAGGVDESVSADVVNTVQRIVVEALTNARRYSPPNSAVEVSISVPRPSVLVLEIVSHQGRAASRARSGGFGLIGLAERAAAVGGLLEAGPIDDHRWRVHAELPC